MSEYNSNISFGKLDLSKPQTKNVTYNEYANGQKYLGNEILSKTILCSSTYRYPDQVKAIKDFLLKNKDKQNTMFIVGVANGQEPLTHIQTALDITKNTGRKIEDILDLSFTDAADYIPITHVKYGKNKIDEQSYKHLEKIYIDKNKAHFGTPLEKIVPIMKKNNEKKDIILFNNVIQHMDNTNPDELINCIGDLIDLVNDAGLFCFTSTYMDEILTKFLGEIGSDKEKAAYDSCQRVIKLLKNKGFVQVSESVWQKKYSQQSINDSLKAQTLYHL